MRSPEEGTATHKVPELGVDVWLLLTQVTREASGKKKESKFLVSKGYTDKVGKQCMLGEGAGLAGLVDVSVSAGWLRAVQSLELAGEVHHRQGAHSLCYPTPQMLSNIHHGDSKECEVYR